MKTWVKNSIAAGFVVVFCGGSVLYNYYLEPKINDATVYVAAQTINPNDPITLTGPHANVQQILLPRADVSPATVTDFGSLQGKLAAQIIPPDQQITTADLEPDPLVPTRGQYVVPVVSSWIAAVPESLRRGDRVDIYLTSNATPYQGSPGGTGTQGNVKFAVNQSDKPYLGNIPVEYVRSGSNEVVNVPDSTAPSGGVLGERLNSTATPNQMELLMTAPQWAKLVDGIKGQNQLIFIYTPSK